MDVVGSVGYSWAELPIRNPPIDSMIVKEQDPGEFSSGIEVGPIDSGAAVTRVEDEGCEG